MGAGGGGYRFVGGIEDGSAAEDVVDGRVAGLASHGSKVCGHVWRQYSTSQVECPAQAQSSSQRCPERPCGVEIAEHPFGGPCGAIRCTGGWCEGAG